MVGRHHLMRTGVIGGGLFIGRARREEIEHRRRVEEIIEFFELERYRKTRVSGFLYGIQKIVGLARAMCSEPRLLLLDEVVSGLNREEKEDLGRFLLRIKHTRNITMGGARCPDGVGAGRLGRHPRLRAPGGEWAARSGVARAPRASGLPRASGRRFRRDRGR
jgi:predicted ABC-type transport system involved in lysophospholipase L1 biosynthesis ATPase subunit